jgi:hypothetical protein
MLGKISGIQSAQDQNRVLEVLQKVQSGGMSQVEGGKELSSLMAEGSSIQERQLTVLEQISNNLKSAMAGTFKRDRQVFGVDEAFKGRAPGETTEQLTGTKALGEITKTIPMGTDLINDSRWQGAFAKGADVSGLANRLGNIETIDFESTWESLKETWGKISTEFMGDEKSVPKTAKELAAPEQRRRIKGEEATGDFAASKTTRRGVIGDEINTKKALDGATEVVKTQVAGAMIAGKGFYDLATKAGSDFAKKLGANELQMARGESLPVVPSLLDLPAEKTRIEEPPYSSVPNSDKDKKFISTIGRMPWSQDSDSLPTPFEPPTKGNVPPELTQNPRGADGQQGNRYIVDVNVSGNIDGVGKKLDMAIVNKRIKDVVEQAIADMERDNMNGNDVRTTA